MRVEAVALTVLRDDDGGRVGVDGVRKPETSRDARRDRNRPVDPGRDEAFDPLCASHVLHTLLVLDGDDGVALRVPHADRARVSVADDDAQTAPPRSA